MISGPWIDSMVLSHPMRLYNQHSLSWTHPYSRPDVDEDATLSIAGCGIFALCHLGQWLTGNLFVPDVLADFSVSCGGRTNDGTDRPALLRAMAEHGLSEHYGFLSESDCLENDKELLWEHMNRGGCALCNLRVGHIVALVAAREKNRKQEYLVIDSYAESCDPRVMQAVTETEETSLVHWPLRNAQKVTTGIQSGYLVYWVSASLPKDYNRLVPIT